MYCKCIRAEDFDHKNNDQGTGPAKPKLKSLSQNPLVAETPGSALLYSINRTHSISKGIISRFRPSPVLALMIGISCWMNLQMLMV